MIRKICILTFIVGLLLNGFAVAQESKAKIEANAKVINLSRELLKVQKWDENYKFEREKDIKYLLGSIDNNSLGNLSFAQKNQVIIIMQNFAIAQLSKDENFFKNYTIEQYTNFFTPDEMQKIVAYFKTKLMQKMIEAKINRKEITLKEMDEILAKSTPEDLLAINNFSSTYLIQRYSRFQENLSSKLNAMIFERTKEILKAIFNSLPNIIKSVEAQQ